MTAKTALSEATVAAPDSRDSEPAAERQAVYERLLDLPEGEEELNADGIRALEEGIEDFAAGRTFTREDIKREFGVRPGPLNRL